MGAALNLFGNPNYRRLWATGALSGVSRWLEFIALGIYAFELTRSPPAVALLAVLVTAGCNAMTGIGDYTVSGDNEGGGNGGRDSGNDAAPDVNSCPASCLDTAATCGTACTATEATCVGACSSQGCKNKCKSDGDSCRNACASTCDLCGNCSLSSCNTASGVN